MISAPASSPASRAIPTRSRIVDGDLRLTYAQWYRRISALVAGFDALGLKPGDHLVTVLQNRWEAATMHWACQFAGIVITPINWRAKADEIDFFVENAEAKAIVYEDVSARSRAGARREAADASRSARVAADDVADACSSTPRQTPTPRASTPMPGR